MNLLEKIQSILLKAGSLIYEYIIGPIVNKLSLLFGFVGEHKPIVFGAFILLTYLVVSYLLIFKYKYFGYNKFAYITNIIFILVAVGFAYTLIYKYYAPAEGIRPTFINILKRLFLILFGIVIIFGFLYIISYSSFYSNSFSTVLLIIGTITALYLLNKQLNKLEIVQKLRNYNLFSLFYHIFFLIPCLIFEGGVNVFNHFKNTPRYVYQLMGVETIIIALYFLIPYLIDKFYTRNSKLLLNKPIYLDNLHTIGTYEDLAPKSKKKNFEYKYNYGISCWIFLDNVAPNYNSNTTSFVNLLNYGDKPSIKFNNKTNTLRVVSQQGIDGEEIIYETNKLPLQRWNHFVINYDGGNTDVFINNKLVGTKAGVIPFMKFDSVQTGQEKGLPGGICNVQYYNEPMSKISIDLEYSTLKDKTPPII